MGPHFDQADRRVGRHRLPRGYVAVLDDEPRLWQVVQELHAYALAGAGSPQPRLGVLFRQADVADREGVTRRLVDVFGAAALLERSALFGVVEGYHYVIDTEGIAHIWNRHADPVAERQRGQTPVALADFGRVPSAVRPRNITGFEQTNGMPRIVYEDASGPEPLVVVLEVQHVRRLLVLRTMYKAK